MDKNQNKQIVIAQRGWVFAGDVREEGENVVIENAECIRRWGTTSGLGQLAREGKQPGTKVDPYGTVEIHKLAVIGRIKVTAQW